ncbi:MAG: helix-turn-helix domain-containing protein [Planctomycetaceae bacterium]
MVPEQPDGAHLGLATVREACEFLRISKPMIYSMMRDGSLPEARRGKWVRIPWCHLLNIARNPALIGQGGAEVVR